MTEISNSKQYDLEERTYRFAKDIVIFCYLEFIRA